MYLRKIGNNYYLYESKREGKRNLSLYIGKATPEQVSEYVKKGK